MKRLNSVASINGGADFYLIAPTIIEYIHGTAEIRTINSIQYSYPGSTTTMK